MTGVPVEQANDLEEIPELRCPMCGHSLEARQLGGLEEGPFMIWFHDRPGCHAILGMS